MTRYAMLFGTALLLSGCTMDIGSPSKPVPDGKTSPWAVSFQNASSAPRGTLREIDVAALQPGDLLFSSSIGITSLGIRLFSTSSVSHVAIYLGDGRVAEAVGSGVQIVTLESALAHSDKLFALRNGTLTPEQAQRLVQFAESKKGYRYNYAGIAQMVPFMLTKQICSLNPFSKEFRRQCVEGFAASQLETLDDAEPNRYFCSQFVIAAWEYAGQPLTVADSAWVSPSDLMHMREGDVATLSTVQPLQYVGHLSPGIYLKARQRAAQLNIIDTP